MDASIEMKALELEKAIRMQKQLMKLETCLGISSQLYDGFVVLSPEDFAGYAAHFGEQIFIGERSMGSVPLTRLTIYHMGFDVHTYATDEEMKIFRNKWEKETSHAGN